MEKRTTAGALADAILAAGGDHVFTLMGHGNMHLIAALDDRGIDVVEVRHESAAVAMAEGFGWGRDSVGFCTVTHGPGLTHTATSLVVAARNRSPLVLVVAEPVAGYTGPQRFDQESFSRSCEAPYVRLGPDDDAAEVVGLVVDQAITERRPVVIGVAADLMGRVNVDRPDKHASPAGAVEPASAEPDWEASAGTVVELLAAAKKPVLLAGRGVIHGPAAQTMMTIADRYGAALATTVPAKGLFDGHRYNLGIAGGLSHDVAAKILGECDLVVAVGSSLSRATLRPLGDATIVQIVDDDRGPVPRPVTRLIAEAAPLMTEIVRKTGNGGEREPAWFGSVVAPATAWQQDIADYAPEVSPGTVDPRSALAVLNDEIPSDAAIVVSNGHCFGFAATFVEVPRDGQFFAAHGFGSIGQAFTTAVGLAVALGGPKVVVFEGDAAFMMHVQEVETAARTGANVTVVVVNDQALGTEYQRLAAEGPYAELAAVATPDLAAVGTALGATGYVIDDHAVAGKVAHDAMTPGLSVIDLRTDRVVRSPHMRQRAMAGQRVAAVHDKSGDQ